MKTMIVPTTTVPYTVPVIDRFELDIGGQPVLFAVHAPPGTVPPKNEKKPFVWAVSEFTRGLRFQESLVCAPREYTREKAVALVQKVAARVGETQFAERLHEKLQAAPVVNPLAQKTGSVAHG